jgi:integrase/recombinase XerD
MDIEEVIQEYLATLKRLRPLTVKGYEQRLTVFCQWLDNVNKQKVIDHLKKITLETVNVYIVDNFVEHLKDTHQSHKPGQEVSSHTLAGYVRIIKCFLNWCLADEEYSQYVKDSTVRRIKLPKLEQKIIEVFSDEQLAAIKKACKQEYNVHLQLRDECIVSLLITTGLRAFELCELTIENTRLEPKESYVKVYGKGSKWREVPMDDKTRRMLKIYKSRYRSSAAPGDTFFVGRAEQKPLTVSGLEKIVVRLGEWAGITGVRCSPHTFRHTFAVTFMKAIGDIYLLSKLMGHSSVRVTEEYLKSFTGKEVRQALLKRMSEM